MVIASGQCPATGLGGAGRGGPGLRERASWMLGWAAVSAFGPDGRCQGLSGFQLRSPPAVLQQAREEARRSRPGDCPCRALMEYACGPHPPLSRHLRGRLKNPRVRLLCESSFSPLLVGAPGGRESALIMGVWARGTVSRSGEPARHPVSL